MPRTSSRAGCTRGPDHDGVVPLARLARLPESQAGEGRHKCAACAYEAGYEDGIKFGRLSMEKRIRSLIARVQQWRKEG